MLLLGPKHEQYGHCLGCGPNSVLSHRLGQGPNNVMAPFGLEPK